MKISREDVLRVADLAHLELSPAEVETYRGQLDEILTYIDKLKQLDVTQVEPMAQGFHGGAGKSAADNASASHPELRNDRLIPCNIAKAVLAESKDSAAPFLRVPRVIER
jgi:aspartyl-tRNA(Asn)/glutamyl-tRNA(Gln) amidotransferase subunit C